MKLLIATVTAALLMLGSSAVVPDGAAAQGTEVRAAADPYPRTVPTKCVASLRGAIPHRPRRKIVINLRVLENVPDANVRSWIGIRRLHNRVPYKTPQVARRAYRGKARIMTFAAPHKTGQWRFLITSHTPKDSQFKYCRTFVTFKVRKKK